MKKEVKKATKKVAKKAVKKSELDIIMEKTGEQIAAAMQKQSELRLRKISNLILRNMFLEKLKFISMKKRKL